MAGEVGVPAPELVDAKIAGPDDWRGATLARMRALSLEAVPDAVEEVKRRGVPVWSRDGILGAGEVCKAAVKRTFAHGAALPDPSGLFDASLEGAVGRAIDTGEGETVDVAAFMVLVQPAARNAAASLGRKRRGK